VMRFLRNEIRIACVKKRIALPIAAKPTRMLYNTFLATTGGAGCPSCNKMVFKPFYQETVLYHGVERGACMQTYKG